MPRNLHPGAAIKNYGSRSNTEHPLQAKGQMLLVPFHTFLYSLNSKKSIVTHKVDQSFFGYAFDGGKIIMEKRKRMSKDISVTNENMTAYAVTDQHSFFEPKATMDPNGTRSWRARRLCRIVAAKHGMSVHSMLPDGKAQLKEFLHGTPEGKLHFDEGLSWEDENLFGYKIKNDRANYDSARG